MWEIMETNYAVRDSPRTVWAASSMIYAINYALVCMMPEMAMKFGFTKWNRCLVISREQ